MNITSDSEEMAAPRGRTPQQVPDATEDAMGDGGPESGSFPVVGVGASAGGLEGFGQLLAHLPEDTGMAFVLVQHLDPKHASKLSDLLAKSTRMPVLDAAHGLEVLPGHVYVIPPNTTLSIVAGILKLEPRGENRGPHLPIDHFFKSLAEDRRTSAIGVILSGTGTDGTLGLEEIKAVGGITFAQDEQTARHAGMPQSAIRSGCIDLILSPSEIADELARIGRHPYLAAARRGEPAMEAAAEKDHFKKVLGLLHSAHGVDFSACRDTTLKRRITRRMVLHTKDSLAEYAAHLERDRAALDTLYQDILINVTSFFREPDAFEAIKTRVLPEIIAGKEPNTPIRIWAPGCSTGQEAYSLAIVLSEFLEDNDVRAAIQIFGTDLSDSVSLHKAREGIYPENIEAEVSPERLRRFFTKEDGGYRVRKSLREMIVFAKQNVAADPPFSRLDLISCRNLLIYLSPRLQKRVIPTFHYALNPTGFLVLGHSETVGAFTDLFRVVDQQHRLYAKKATAARQYPHFQSADHPPGTDRDRTPAASAVSVADWQREADRVVLGRYVPPGVLVNENLEILQFRGRTGPYLAPAPGEPSHNLLKMAREGLFPVVRAALIECQQQDAAVHKRGVRIRGEAADREIELHVLPIKPPHAGERCFLVLFEENLPRTQLPPEAAPQESPAHAEAGELHLVRQELASTREYLQSVIEQQDAANEELKSANEEILSSNEELQGANEELETAKEELQSVNEELTTVNEQLQSRNVDLGRLNDDITNLVGSSSLPMVVLGIDLRIRSFTPATARVLDLQPTDVGRPIGAVKPPIDAPDLEALVAEVIDTVRMQEREVLGKDDRCYALRIHPYRTSDNRIDGAVLVLVDIDALKRSERQAKAAEAYAQAILQTTPDPLVVLRADLHVNSANEAFYRIFRVTPEKTEGRLIYDLGNGQWDIPRLRTLLEEILPRNSSFNDFEVEHEFPDIGRRTMLLNARRIRRPDDRTELILLAIRDDTGRKNAETTLRAQREWLSVTLASIGDAVIVMDAEGRITYMNPVARTLTGWRDEAIGKELPEVLRLVTGATRQVVESPFRRVLREGKIVGLAHRDTLLIRKDGAEVPIDDSGAPIRNERGEIAGVVLVFHDATERRQARAALEASEARYRRLFETAQDAILILEAESGKIVDTNPFVEGLLGYSHDELMGKELWRIGLFKDIQANRDAFRELQEKGYIRYEDLPLETKSGRRVAVEFVSNVYPVNDHQVIQCNIRDISARKKAEEALKEADRRKDEFLAMLAHELRNPLAPIRNAVQVQRLKGSAGPEGQWAADVIDRQVQQLSRLVDDLMDVSRITRGKINLKLEPVNLAEVADRAVEISRPLIDARKHRLEVTLPNQAVWVEGDLTRLAQVASNLLNNAAKYSEEGGRIRLTLETNDNEGVIRVQDTGIGIAAEMLPSIFTMFTQVQGSVSRSEGGLGIGLSLVRSIVELHGGGVQAASAGVGHGSEFVVRLPRLQASPPAAAELNAQRTRKASPQRILLVDDNLDAAKSLAMLLRLYGHQVRTACDGPTALDAVRLEPPDVVLLDIGLPTMDGLEVARRMRQDLGLNNALLVALTGYGQDEDRRRSQKAGFNAHLVKPVDLDALQELLSRRSSTS